MRHVLALVDTLAALRRLMAGGSRRSQAWVCDAGVCVRACVRAGVQVVSLAQSDLVKPEHWPRFTLLGQAYGSVALTHEALSKLVPEVCGWLGEGGGHAQHAKRSA